MCGLKQLWQPPQSLETALGLARILDKTNVFSGKLLSGNNCLVSGSNTHLRHLGSWPLGLPEH